MLSLVAMQPVDGDLVTFAKSRVSVRGPGSLRHRFSLRKPDTSF